MEKTEPAGTWYARHIDDTTAPARIPFGGAEYDSIIKIAERYGRTRQHVYAVLRKLQAVRDKYGTDAALELEQIIVTRWDFTLRYPGVTW